MRFDEFTQYIVNGAVGGPVLDIHWEPVYEICKPCHVQYDYIGHYETFGYKIPDEFRRKIDSLERNVTDLKIR